MDNVDNIKPRVTKISGATNTWEAKYVSPIGQTYKVVSQVSFAQAVKDWHTKYGRVFGLPYHKGG